MWVTFVLFALLGWAALAGITGRGVFDSRDSTVGLRGIAGAPTDGQSGSS